MAAKDRTPSAWRVSTGLFAVETFELTNGGDDLRLHAVLVLEAAGEVANASPTIPCDVRHLPDLVEHVAAGEQQYADEADGGPDIAVLDDREDVRPCNVACGRDE